MHKDDEGGSGTGCAIAAAVCFLAGLVVVGSLLGSAADAVDEEHGRTVLGVLVVIGIVVFLYWLITFDKKKDGK